MLKSISEEEPVSDATPLSPRELTRLSRELVGTYVQIANLENLATRMVENVRLDHVTYKNPKEKAEAILSMISEKPDFSRKILSDHLEEEGLKYLKDKVLNESYRCDDDSPDVSTSTTAEN